MFFYNALQLWKNISDNDFVYSTDLKKFSKNYFDHIMREFTPDSFKIDRIFSFLLSDLKFYVILSFYSYLSILNVL